jgi:hypothetical protein
MEHLRAAVPRFTAYFSPYCTRANEWTFCHRRGTQVSTNMYLELFHNAWKSCYMESFHNVLKSCYMERKANRHIDSLVQILLRVASDKAFERLIKVEKTVGLTAKQLGKLAKDVIVVSHLPPLADGGWSVPSQGVPGQSYLVIPVAASCSCNLKCRYCRCCPHLYQCSCLDFAVHATVCKHVHTIHEMRGTTYTDNEEVDVMNEEVVDHVVTDPLPSPSRVVADEPSSEAIPCELGKEEMNNGASDKQIIQNIVSQCREISAIATSGNVNRETLLAIQKQITAIKTTVKATATVSAMPS